jgi:hypothetical protein
MVVKGRQEREPRAHGWLGHSKKGSQPSSLVESLPTFLQHQMQASARCAAADILNCYLSVLLLLRPLHYCYHVSFPIVIMAGS